MPSSGGRGKSRSEEKWIELYGGPGDGTKRRRTHFPVTMIFPDDFIVESHLEQRDPVLYTRWERVDSLIEDQFGKVRLVDVMLYYSGDEPPLHRQLTYDKKKA